MKTLVLFLTITSIILAGCGNTKSKYSIRTNPYSAPQLDERKDVTLIKRNSDNYEATCLYLNESFKKLNTCAISLQSNLAINGAQVVGQNAEFIKAQSPATLSSYTIEESDSVGERIDADQVQVGDVWYFKKSNEDYKYELVFEILSANQEEITVRYEVKSYSNIW